MASASHLKSDLCPAILGNSGKHQEAADKQVVPAGEDRYEVDAGGRRLQALKLLARTGAIARDFPVPCNVIALDCGCEVSLIENIHRVAMDAMDKVDAHAALIAEGSTPEQIALRLTGDILDRAPPVTFSDQLSQYWFSAIDQISAFVPLPGFMPRLVVGGSNRSRLG